MCAIMLKESKKSPKLGELLGPELVNRPEHVSLVIKSSRLRRFGKSAVTA